MILNSDFFVPGESLLDSATAMQICLSLKTLQKYLSLQDEYQK